MLVINNKSDFRSKCKNKTKKQLRRYVWIWKTLNRVNLTETGERERERERERARERERDSLHKEPVGCISPPEPNPSFGPQCQAASKGVVKNLIIKNNKSEL